MTKKYGKIYQNKQNVSIVANDLYNVWPVGSIYISVINTNPSEYFGGVWESFGEGQVLVGVDTSQTEFNSVQKTGGSNSHSHQYGIQYSVLYGGIYARDVRLIRTYNGLNGSWNTSTANGSVSEQGNNGVRESYGDVFNCAQYQSINNTTSSSNLMPYITVYMWKRLS